MRELDVHAVADEDDVVASRVVAVHGWRHHIRKPIDGRTDRAAARADHARFEDRIAIETRRQDARA